MANVEKVSDLKARQPGVATRLFQGSGGHDLAALAKESRLSRLLAADSVDDVAGEAWDRMCDRDRPYSLRYGAEAVTAAQLQAELAVAKRVQAALEGAVR